MAPGIERGNGVLFTAPVEINKDLQEKIVTILPASIAMFVKISLFYSRLYGFTPYQNLIKGCYKNCSTELNSYWNQYNMLQNHYAIFKQPISYKYAVLVNQNIDKMITWQNWIKESKFINDPEYKI